mmetsp:Transcript_34649/g.80896  ORF Transcript_34649/g.80896 Transcript_34649/m.80896 type:complete len:127 (-) Transcript_34649:82-462(-)|eukprot:CAMPEP_0178438574 /NCGR_PEP_ID=MMETSP0689_2-20121128/35665_1 /TAXON_ID=160604 /ORGANISM="Amphidinium massartii, Strain CS-259" /LENGTH=126 /DNA_ID=CAMNT_0020060985 /DNA_START=57 /DNA_END=437 /DNA_ORIENTATION=+
MARAGRLVLFAAALVLASTVLPSKVAFTGSRTAQISQTRVGMRAGSQVYIGNLDYAVSLEELKDHMGQVGELEDAYIGRSGAKKFAFVVYTDEGDVETAIEKLDGTQLGKRAIKVAKATGTPKQES